MKVQKVLVKTVGGQYRAEVVNDEPDRFGRIRVLFNSSEEPEQRPIAAVIFLEKPDVAQGVGGIVRDACICPGPTMTDTSCPLHGEEA